MADEGPFGAVGSRSVAVRGGTEPRSARRRGPPGRPAARGRRRRLGQDPGAHPSHRPPHPRGRAPLADPRHHVHQQGGGRDARARRRARRPGRQEDVGVARSTRRACGSCAPTPTGSATRGQFRIYDQADAHRLTGYVIRDLGLDAKRFTPRGVHGHDQPAGRTSWSTPTRRSGGRPNIFDRKHADVYREYQARLHKAGAMDFDDLLMKTVGCSATPRRARALPASGSSTSSSTSTRTPTGAQNEIVLLLAAGHAATSPSSATTTSRSTGSAAPTCATSSSSRRRSPTSPRSCSTRTTAARRPSSTPPTRSSPTTRPQAEAAVDRQGSGRSHRALPRRGRGRRGHVGGPHDASAPRATTLIAGARWPSSTAPTPRAACVEEALMRIGVPYKVVGGTRFYDRREIKDAMAYLRGRREPGRRGQRQAGAQRAQARASATPASPSSTRSPRASGDQLRRGACATPTRPGVGPARRVAAIDAFVRAARRARWRRRVGDPTRSAGRRAAGGARASAATSPSSRPRTSVESAGRLENLGELIGSAREFTPIDEFLEQVLARRRHRRARRRRDQGRADDAALGQGPRVPGRVPRRRRGGRVPAHPGRSPNPTSWRRSGASPTSASPGPRSGCTSAHAWSRSLFGTRSTTRRRGSSTRSRPSWSTSQGNVSRPQQLRPPELPRRSATTGASRRRTAVATAAGRDDRRRGRPAERRPPRPRRRGGAAAGRSHAPHRRTPSDLGLRVGDDVEHPTFGEGVIIEIRGQGDRAEATIRFPDVGTKHLSLAWAPLKKL